MARAWTERKGGKIATTCRLQVHITRDLAEAAGKRLGKSPDAAVDDIMELVESFVFRELGERTPGVCRNPDEGDGGYRLVLWPEDLYEDNEESKVLPGEIRIHR